MSEGTLGKLVSKAGEVISDLAQKSCVDAVKDGSNSQVQAYTKLTATNLDGFNAFNEAFLHQDLDGIMANMTDDPIFDAPNPQPNGMCIKGAFLVRTVWELTFKAGVTFEVEEAFVTGDRAVTRWVAYRTVDGKKLSLRGSDVFHMKDGKVAAKITYSKADDFLGISLPT